MNILRTLLHIAEKLLIGIAGLVILGVLGLVGIYIFFSSDLPDITSLEDYHPPIISEVFDKHGEKLGEFWTECRIFTPYEKIPPRIIQAFLDAEDDRFYEHHGVDLKAIVRAFVTNIRAGSVKQGGSTITQQVTRSLVLTRERSLTRKIKEAILATRLERHLNKEQILTLYLNQIYLGNRAYGIAAAARNYFHKSIDELKLAEIALIAGLPTAPTSFSPVVNPEAARRRQFHVLNRLRDNGHISAEEYQAALAEQLTIYVAGIDKDFTDPDAAYLVEHVRLLAKERYGDDALYHGGLKIHTPVDLRVQRAAMRAVQKGVVQLDRRQGYRGPKERVERGALEAALERLDAEVKASAHNSQISWPPQGSAEPVTPLSLEEGKLYRAVVTDVEGDSFDVGIGEFRATIKRDGFKWARRFNTSVVGYDDANYVSDPRAVVRVGDIVEIRRRSDESFELAQTPAVQGALFSYNPHDGLVAAMVGGIDFKKSEFNRATQALRQPGSSWKPLIYAAALDKGYTSETQIEDSPITFHVGPGVTWSPKNYDEEFHGVIPFRKALLQSRNVPTVKIAYDIGTHYVTGFARKLGITTPIEKYLSMALGANAVYLYDMVQVYAVFASYGVPRIPIFITRVEDARGDILEEYTPLQKASPSKAADAVVNTAEPVESTEEERAPSEEEQQKLAEEIRKATRSVEASDLNPELFAKEQKTIAADKLVLTDLELKTLYGSSIPKGHVITPQTAYLMQELLRGVVNEGTGTRVKELGKPAAGKTGTTNDETDTWFIGFVPDLVAGVWLGFDEPRPIGKKETGGRTSSPIFLEFMKAATEGWEAKDFVKPEGFPAGNLAQLAGGSVVIGSMPRKGLAGDRTGSDRAGSFFEEDLESSGEGW